MYNVPAQLDLKGRYRCLFADAIDIGPWGCGRGTNIWLSERTLILYGTAAYEPT
jgi:hypothetical protein